MKCTLCNSEARWVENKEVYGRNFGKSWMIWLCGGCGAYVGCHNNTKEAKGTFADKETRKARIAAHAVIDPLWQSGKLPRSEVYGRLSRELGYNVHVGGATKSECEEIVIAAQRIF